MRSCYSARWFYDLDNNLYRNFRYVFMPDDTPCYNGKGIYTSAAWLAPEERGGTLGDDGIRVSYWNGRPYWTLPPPDPERTYAAATGCTDNTRVVPLVATTTPGYPEKCFPPS